MLLTQFEEVPNNITESSCTFESHRLCRARPASGSKTQGTGSTPSTHFRCLKARVSENVLSKKPEPTAFRLDFHPSFDIRPLSLLRNQSLVTTLKNYPLTSADFVNAEARAVGRDFFKLVATTDISEGGSWSLSATVPIVSTT